MDPRFKVEAFVILLCLRLLRKQILLLPRAKYLWLHAIITVFLRSRTLYLDLKVGKIWKQNIKAENFIKHPSI